MPCWEPFISRPFLLALLSIHGVASVFIPTLPPLEDDSKGDPGLGRLDLTISNTTEHSPGILIGGNTVRISQVSPSRTSTEAPYGSWPSPVTSNLVTEPISAVVEPPRIDPITGLVFWSEELNGRRAVYHFDPDIRKVVRWTAPDYDVVSRVHEYGGGSFTVYNNTLFFSRGEDDAMYRQEGPASQPSRLTQGQKKRYADGVYSPEWNALFLVMEDHSQVEEGGLQEPRNSIVMVDASSGKEKIIVEHADFFASPRITQDGLHLVWIQWNHPRMPWDENQMFVAGLKEHETDITISRFFQHGRLGRQAYDINPRLGAREAVVICGHDLTVVDLRKQKRRVIKTGYTTYSLGVAYSKAGDKVYTVASDGSRHARLVEVEVRTGRTRDVSQASDAEVEKGYISTARLMQFPTTQGDFAYGYLYSPKNKDYHAPAGTLPPLLVKVHEGPTDAASTALNLYYQFFTSRGFAILDVDYRGSTGYGKLYRNKLNEMWGVYDVEDVLAGAKHVVKEGLVDEARVCIDSSSMAAYTMLSALTIPGSVFKAGASYYGVSDPETMATNTHKFKKNYMEALIGNLDRHKDRYVTRSPLRNYERLEVPMIFFHGANDKVVPPDQVRGMYNLVKTKQLPAAFIVFDDEGHVFTHRESLSRALEAEFYFFAMVFNFTPADIVSDITIDNMDGEQTGKEERQFPSRR
ncbi:acylamino-acid-releasing enzyme-like isoform X2 [Portunus trituberculatus]|uniref:acylamino-acid-releasing enzyme-like isoform X2 n=1 Tax=Portunus trituberculatus TaxID=210409 RepID=UPI001E1D0481|nr:acylamino-acid-releasing enzyme-like isoform X2 [Portunus trituberculatus]